MRLFVCFAWEILPYSLRGKKGGDLCDQCKSGQSQCRTVADPGGGTSPREQINSQPVGDRQPAGKCRHQAEVM